MKRINPTVLAHAVALALFFVSVGACAQSDPPPDFSIEIIGKRLPPEDPPNTDPGRPSGLVGGISIPSLLDLPSRNVDKPVADDNSNKPKTCKPEGGAPDATPASPNPVIIATGEKYKLETDIRAGSTYGLALNRTFRSFLPVNVTPMFGPKWMSEYDYPKLKASVGCTYNAEWGCVPNSVVVYCPDGAHYTYNRVALQSLNYTVRGSSAMGTMMYDPGSGWNLHKDKKIAAYDTNGVIESIMTDGGTTLLQFFYGADPFKPASVANAVGQTISFTYTNGKVTAVTDPAGGVWTYAYNANNMLSSITTPGVNPDIRTYLYEDTNVQFLSGISINGVRYSTFRP